MTEMSSVREVHRQNFVARFNGGKIHSHVCLCAAVRLHIYVFAAKELFCAIDCQLLGNIDIFTSAIPPLSWVTLSVFVCENAALRFHHRAAGEIFRCDQFDIFALAFFFRGDRIESLRINSA